MTTYAAASYNASAATRTFATYAPLSFDYPVRALWGTKTISGTATKKSDGSVLVGLTVYLVRALDGFPCGSTVTDGSGNFSFTRDAADPYEYRVEATKTDGGIKLHGTTDWDLVPT